MFHAMTDFPRVSFEFTIDEAVDARRQFVESSPEASSWRRREKWNFVGAFILVASVVAFLLARQRLHVIAIVVGFACIALLAIVLAIPFGWYYDHLVKRRVRRFLIEQYGGEGPHPCTIELRPEGLWAALPTIQMSFPWQEATGFHDAAQGITVTFKGGRVLIRSRGFGSEAERGEFLRQLRHLVPQTASQEPRGAA